MIEFTLLEDPKRRRFDSRPRSLMTAGWRPKDGGSSDVRDPISWALGIALGGWLFFEIARRM